jgi:starch synthase
MKYGTLPIVREIGGLKDTVKKYDEKNGTGTGFTFNDISARALYYGIGWAVSTYYDRPRHMKAMIQQAMSEDYSWERSVREYEAVYDKALARKKTWK